VRCALKPLVKSFFNKDSGAEAVAGHAFPRVPTLQSLKV
jgi:hypothetical protein